MSKATTYSELVREAFIDPIRSVMIIDDDYPTWDEILDENRWNQDDNGKLNSSMEMKGWRNNPNGPQSVLRQFRDGSKSLMIDIHDGRSPQNWKPKDFGSFLHQSDLLVLDYQLDGPGGGGHRAQEIAKQLLNHNHFNLIVVHTGTPNLLEPFSEILLQLFSKCASGKDFDRRVKSGKKLVDEVEVEVDNFSKALTEQFDYSQYFMIRQLGPVEEIVETLFAGEMPFTGIKKLLDEVEVKNHGSLKKIYSWLMRDFERRHSAAFAEETSTGLRWVSIKEVSKKFAVKTEDKCLWIRTDRGFITFALKNETSNILRCLQLALEDWGPTPSRLLSAKFRHALDEYGAAAEDKTLSKKHVYAKFYDDILKAEPLKRSALLDAHVVRQTERINAEVQDKVRDFGLTIADVDNGSADDSRLLDYYDVKIGIEPGRKTSVYHYNNYVSCIPVHGYHLTSGHIFELNGTKWVVVSPACDMEPGQKPMGIKADRTNGDRPFVALQLFKCTETLTDLEINSSNFVFLEEEGDVEAYCTFPPSLPAIERIPKVNWRSFVALKNGILTDDGVPNGKKSVEILEIEVKLGKVESTQSKAPVIAQLRYEFALNLIHRLGMTMTRVGLDYTAGMDD